MSDYESTNIAAASYLSGVEPGGEERPSRADVAFDEHGEKGPDPYVGKCGGCGARTARDERGSCLHRWVPRLHGTAKRGQSLGPWHPDCRRADTAAEPTMQEVFEL